MAPDEILARGDRICDFLISCGGAYTQLTGEIQEPRRLPMSWGAGRTSERSR